MIISSLTPLLFKTRDIYVIKETIETHGGLINSPNNLNCRNNIIELRKRESKTNGLIPGSSRLWINTASPSKDIEQNSLMSRWTLSPVAISGKSKVVSTFMPTSKCQKHVSYLISTGYVLDLEPLKSRNNAARSGDK